MITFLTIRHMRVSYKSNDMEFDWKEACMQEHLGRHVSSPISFGFEVKIAE